MSISLNSLGGFQGVRCDRCGKYVSHEKAHCDYTPETLYGHERYIHVCESCQDKFAQDQNKPHLEAPESIQGHI